MFFATLPLVNILLEMGLLYLLIKVSAVHNFYQLPFLFFRDRLRGIVNIMGDSFGAAIVEHLSRDDLLLVGFESRDPQSEQPLYPLATRYTPKHENYRGGPARSLDDDSAKEKLMDKDKLLDKNLNEDKPIRLTETAF